ncbi:conserved exported hypothetical protein [Vibrio owensii]|uniref:hypothetical protein n=1 Tax=Vibrio owensii TaxID=696485 RepID=UPI002894FD4D|nr:conserved exported hypothetical protein [Vibrio owensii]CAH1586442.1 conserved exported hypothetical protein [Vibrio owensii]
MRQFLILYLYVSLMFFSSMVLADDSITKILNLSAHIENNDFFSYKVTKFDFVVPELTIKYNYETEQFDSASTEVVLETDVPLSFPAGFELIATDLSSYCEDASGAVLAHDFANYFYDGKKLVRESSLSFDSFNNSYHPDAFFLNDKRLFTVSFNSIPGLDVSKAYCQGAATLVVSLDL